MVLGIFSTEKLTSVQMPWPQIKKEALKSREVFLRDKERDKKIKPKPLNKPTNTFRFVPNKKDLNKGVPSGKHMTAKTSPRPLPSPENAKKELGLSKNPKYRATVKFPEGLPVKKGKVLGGKPGMVEITSTKALPKEAITKITKLPKRKE